MLVGVLIAEAIIRVELADQQVANEERVELGARIRDVVQGPDGAIYALADHDPGALVRLTPGAD